MWNNFAFNHPYGPMMGIGLFAPLIFVFTVLVLALKGYTLWHAAKRNEIWWFVALLVLQTAGILELVYIIFVLKKFSMRPEALTFKKDEPKEEKKHEHNHTSGQ